MRSGKPSRKERSPFWSKLRSTCTCVSCGFTERLPDDLVSDMIRQRRGCPVHGDGSWPPQDQIEYWLLQDYIDFIEAFLAYEIEIALFLNEFSLQFDDQAQGFTPDVFEVLFALYAHQDDFFAARSVKERSAKESLRKAAKLARDQLQTSLHAQSS